MATRITLMRQFEKALKGGIDPDLDAIDGIVSDPRWRGVKPRSKPMRQLEQQVLLYLTKQAQQMLPDDGSVDLKGISNITQRPAWHLLFSSEKRMLEHRLEEFLKEAVNDLTGKGRATSAAQRIEFFEESLGNPELLKTLREKIQACRKSREAFKAHAKTTITEIETLAGSGDFQDGEALLAELLEACSDDAAVQRAAGRFRRLKSRFEQQIRDLEQYMTTGALDTAANLLKGLRIAYPEHSRISSLAERLRKKMAGEYIEDALHLEKQDTGGVEKAFQRLLARSQKHTHVLMPEDILEDRRAFALLTRYAEHVAQRAMKALCRMDLNAFRAHVDNLGQYEALGAPASGILGQAVSVVLAYEQEKQEADLKGQLNALVFLKDLASSKGALPEGCVLLQTLKELEQIRTRWSAVLAESPETREAILENLALLEQIAHGDRGEYGTRAVRKIARRRDRLKALKLRSLRRELAGAEAVGNWPEALQILRAMQPLDPEEPLKDRISALEKRLDEEERILSQALQKKESGYLNQAVRMISPLTGTSAFRERAMAMKQELEAAIRDTEARAEHLFQTGAGAYEAGLQNLSDEALNSLNVRLKEWTGRFRDSRMLLDFRERLDRENAVRGRLLQIQNRALEVEKAGGRAALGDFSGMVRMVAEALAENPGYAPLERMQAHWKGRLEAHLLSAYETAARNNACHGAFGVVGQWKRYLKDEDMAAAVSAALGEELSFQTLQDRMDRADRESIIAGNLYSRLELEESRKCVLAALKLCGDDPKALGLRQKLEAWDSGVAMLRRVEEMIRAYDQKISPDLVEAQELLDRVQKLPVRLRDLKGRGLSWNSLARFADEIENRIGLIGKIRLSLLPGKSYLLFLTDEIAFGSPKDPHADVRIQAGGIRPKHGRIVRKGKAFTLQKGAGECRVGETSGKEVLLKKGDEIRLGGTFTFQVAALSQGSLVLSMTNSNPVDYSLDGIILMGDELVLGPGKDSHVRVPRMKGGCRVRYEENAFYGIAGGERTSLSLGEQATLGDVKVLLAREH